MLPSGRTQLRMGLLGALLVALLGAASACSDDGTTTTTSASTTSPTGNITETFTGTLTLNGAATFPFTSLSSGAIAATLTAFTPDTTLKVGIWLGVFANGLCSFGVANDDAVQGSTINAFAVQAGNYCVRVYDSKGNIPQTETYQIDVTHP